MKNDLLPSVPEDPPDGEEADRVPRQTHNQEVLPGAQRCKTDEQQREDAREGGAEEGRRRNGGEGIAPRDRRGMGDEMEEQASSPSSIFATVSAPTRATKQSCRLGRSSDRPAMP